jgi:hypothetical protein
MDHDPGSRSRRAKMTHNIIKSCPVPDWYSAKMLDPDRIRIRDTAQKRVQMRPFRYPAFCLSIYRGPERLAWLVPRQSRWRRTRCRPCQSSWCARSAQALSAARTCGHRSSLSVPVYQNYIYLLFTVTNPSTNLTSRKVFLVLLSFHT